MKKYIYIALSALALSSCNDFLEREPLDFASDESYYKTANDLRIAVNDFYEILPVNGGGSRNTGLYYDDVQSDNQATTAAQELMYPGNKRTVDISASEWNFSNLRGINFCIQKILENFKEEERASGTLIGHYLGEAYFFRAWDHFRLLRFFGDAPILTKMLSDDTSELIQASKRYPRNEVARFIIEQLDLAADLMQETPLEKGRLTRDAALALKSRVALYEATWEKYHAGTCFVPGNSKWVGKDLWPDFQFKAGSAEAEINWFLEQAIDASEKAVVNHPLSEDYMSLFNVIDLSDNQEVILARYYLPGILSHNCSTYLRNGGGCGVTRQAVNTFLMANGLPIYATGSNYYGDETSYDEFRDRDPRLAGERNADGSYNLNEIGRYTFGAVRAAGTIMNGTDTIFHYAPFIYNTGQDRATTGYEVNKWVTMDQTQWTGNSSYTAVPIFRSAECMLNYIEAYYERYGALGGNCDTYWKAIRRRAGVDENYQATIAATVLANENDLATIWRGQTIDVTLYNIRRERRCEFIAEGRRLDDLKRWRAFENMVSWQPEGFKIWGVMQNMYSQQQLSSVSKSSASLYMRPLQANTSNNAYNGYNFPKGHYLEPIPISEFALTIDPSTGKSVIYQNPGWPSNTSGTANSSYDYD